MMKMFANSNKMSTFVATVPALHPVRSARGSSFFIAYPPLIPDFYG